MKNKEIDVICFQKCVVHSIEEKKYFSKLLKQIKENSNIYFLIKNSKNHEILEHDIFQLKEMQLKHVDVMYNFNKKEMSQKSINNMKIYLLKINKENIDTIKEFICFVFQLTDNNDTVSSIIISKEKRAYCEIDFEHKYIIVNQSNIIVKNVVLCVLFIIVLIITLKIFLITIIPSNNHVMIGIIDGAYTKKTNNVIYNVEPSLSLTEKTHGDEMIDFAKHISKNVDIYYYDASNEQGIINTENLLQALEYMKAQGVTRISLSISSKKYSADLDEWFKNNTDIKVFASYNNLINSKDYPAMYDNVYGSGKKVDIKYKKIDYTYLNNSIIILPNIFKIYTGNSYLSLYNTISK